MSPTNGSRKWFLVSQVREWLEKTEYGYCGTCYGALPLSDFWPSNTRRCKECMATKAKESLAKPEVRVAYNAYHNNYTKDRRVRDLGFREAIKEYQRTWRENKNRDAGKKGD